MKAALVKSISKRKKYKSPYGSWKPANGSPGLADLDRFLATFEEVEIAKRKLHSVNAQYAPMLDSTAIVHKERAMREIQNAQGAMFKAQVDNLQYYRQRYNRDTANTIAEFDNRIANVKYTPEVNIRNLKARKRRFIERRNRPGYFSKSYNKSWSAFSKNPSNVLGYNLHLQ